MPRSVSPAPRSAWPQALLPIVLVILALAPVDAQRKPRARDLGVPFDGTPGPLDAITDVRRRTVGIDVIDLMRLDSGVAQSMAHHAIRAVAIF